MKSLLVSMTLVLASVQGAAEVSFTKEDAKLAYETAAALVKEHTPRDAGTLRGRLAAKWLMDRASWCGADVVVDEFTAQTPKGEKKFSNVMLEYPGTRTNASWIVVMSHFDTAPTAKQPFQGANDGASTSGLLVALAGAIRRAGPQPYGVMLVWTDGEECQVAYGPNDGFQGSRHLVDLFRRQGRSVKTAICLDMLGDKDLHIMVPANTTEPLKQIALMAAKRIGQENLVKINDSIVVSDDHSAFLEAGCPSIDLIDFDYGHGNAWWHTPEDTMDKISLDSLETSGRLVAAFINLLQLSR